MYTSARKVVISTLVLLFENIARLTAVVVVSFWIARHLGPEQFGILNFASAFMAIMLSISALGMEIPLTLRLTQSKYPVGLVGTALYIRSIFSFFIFLLSVFIAFILKGKDDVSFSVSLIVCICIIGYVPNIFDCWFKANTSALAPAIVRTSATLLASCVKIICLVFGLGIFAFAWTVVLESAVAALGFFIAYRLSTNKKNKHVIAIDKELISPLLRDSTPYLWSSVGTLLYLKADVVMLGYLSTNYQTGIYSLAQKISEVLYVIPIILIDSAYSSITKKHLNDEYSQTKNHGQLLFDLAVGGSLIATLMALILAAPLIRFTFGNEYLESVHIFYLHAWSCVAIALNTVRHRWLANVGLQRYAPTVTLIGLVTNILLNLILIPKMGGLGAAIATIISYFISGYITSFIFTPLREIGLMQTRALWPWIRLYGTLNSKYHWIK